MTSLTFAAPPPGLAPLVDFTLEPVDGAPGLFSLQAKAEPTVRLFVLEAAVYFPGYTPSPPRARLEPLGLAGGEDAKVLVVANPGPDGITANLMAPILVNTATGRCMQLVLDGSGWPLRAELVHSS